MKFHPNNCEHSYEIGKNIIVRIFGDYGSIDVFYKIRWISEDGEVALGEVLNKDNSIPPDEDFLIFRKDNSPFENFNYYCVVER